MLFASAGSLFISQKSLAQDKGKIEVLSAKQKGETVEFSILSTTPFYVGGNMHILHICNKEFKLSKLINKDEQHIMTFFIPASEFNSLTDGENIWLTYGEPVNRTKEKKKVLEVMSKDASRTCWEVGKFKKSVLTN